MQLQKDLWRAITKVDCKTTEKYLKIQNHFMAEVSSYQVLEVLSTC